MTMTADVTGSAREAGEVWMGRSALDRVDRADRVDRFERAMLLVQIAALVEMGTSRLTQAQLLSAVCKVLQRPLSLAHAVLSRRVAGQSRSASWSLRGGPSPREADDTAVVAVIDERLGLSATLAVASTRTLREDDRELLEEVLRRVVGARHEGRRLRRDAA